MKTILKNGGQRQVDAKAVAGVANRLKPALQTGEVKVRAGAEGVRRAPLTRGGRYGEAVPITFSSGGPRLSQPQQVQNGRGATNFQHPHNSVRAAAETAAVRHNDGNGVQRSQRFGGVERAAAETAAVRPNSPCSLANTAGYWELSLYGHRAALPQHPALFYLAWLFAEAPAAPIGALELAAHVFSSFQAHADLLHSLPWLCRQQQDADVNRVFKRKKHSLEQILNDPYQTAVVKDEVELEYDFIERLQETYFAELLPPGEKTVKRIWNDLLDLLAKLATAVNARGEPRELVRAFGRYVLLCVIIPSVKEVQGNPDGQYVYQPE